jgi:hypothetical protein
LSGLGFPHERKELVAPPTAPATLAVHRWKLRNRVRWPPELVSKALLRVQTGEPQGLKPVFWADLGGTAESRALPKTDFQNQ